MAADTIKEFLVKLGFKVDDAGLKKFSSALVGVGKTVAKLGAVMTATATAVEIGVERIAGQLEELYYVSQRTGTSVRNIQKLQYAFGQIGLTAEGAKATLEGLAKAIRSNPGVEGLIKNLGVNTRDSATGQMRDTSEVLGELIARFKTMPFYIAAQFAAQLGIDSDTLLQLINNFDKAAAAGARFGKQLEDAGVDSKKLSEDSTTFMNHLRDLEATLGILGQLMATRFLPMAEKVLAWVQSATEWIISLDKATDGWSTILGTLAVAIGSVSAALAIITPLLAPLATGIGVVVTVVRLLTAALLLNPVGALITALTAGAIAIIMNWDSVKATFSSFFDWLSPKIEWFNEKMKPITNWFKSNKQGYEKPTVPGPASGPLGIRNNNPGNLRSWVGAEQGEGGFAKFRSPIEGLSKMATQLALYGQRGYDTLEKIVSKWAPPGENNTKAYIDDLVSKTGYGASQVLNLRDPEVLKKLLPAITAHENGQQPYSADQISAAVSAARLGPGSRGSSQVSIQQKTEIHVAGAGDAGAVARSVADSQSRVNGDMVRNMEGALR